jgi:NAD(P)-dependent dehydrogenase (short-subunit alcohol dehydrogenase family)
MGGGINLFDLSGRVAIVTGGARGLGRTAALGLAEAGADVVVIDLLMPMAEEVKAEIVKKGKKSLAIKTDVSDGEDVQRMVDKVVEHFGMIDILVNNAGINIVSPAERFSLADWNSVLRVNLTGVFLCAQAVGIIMLRQKKGKIINIASVLGMVGSPHDALAYNSSKAGVINLTRSLAVEWGEYNINVNAVAPGMMETDLTRRRLEDNEYRSYFVNATPLRRIGRPEDLLGTVIFLSSEASDWITGQTIVVDGGYLAL